MVTENAIQDLSFPANEDLSADQYRFVVYDTTTKQVRRPDTKAERPRGILQNAPAAAGQAAVVRVAGISKMRVGGAVALGDRLVPEFVSAADAGKGLKSASGYNWVGAIVTEITGTAAEDELVGVEIVVEPAFKRHQVNLPVFSPNATVYVGLLDVPGPIRVVRIIVSAYIIPDDADGTTTIQIINYDLSATTEDELAAAWNAEGLTAKTGTSLTLTATAADLILAEGDTVYAVLVNNSAAINTNWAAASVTIEYEEMPS